MFTKSCNGQTSQIKAGVSSWHSGIVVFFLNLGCSRYPCWDQFCFVSSLHFISCCIGTGFWSFSTSLSTTCRCIVTFLMGRNRLLYIFFRDCSESVSRWMTSKCLELNPLKTDSGIARKGQGGHPPGRRWLGGAKVGPKVHISNVALYNWVMGAAGAQICVFCPGRQISSLRHWKQSWSGYLVVEGIPLFFERTLYFFSCA